MASVTRRSTATLPNGEQHDWPIFVCREGIFLFDRRAYFPVDPAEAFFEGRMVQAKPKAGLVILPPCRDKDEVLDQPPLGLRLSSSEAEKLIIDSIGAVGASAATDFGIPEQDKASNQDFALAATFRIARPDGVTAVYQFAAVADGVSTRTFWPERAARLAVLTAWRVAREHVEADRGFSHQALEGLRSALAARLRSALVDDSVVIMAAGEELCPAGWDKRTYAQNRDRDDLWYNSTLLVALIGAEAGFVATCGDGGVVVRKSEHGEVKSSVLLHSTDDVAVSGVVSLLSDAFQFRQTRILLTSDTELDIVMSSDGVDRSLRRAHQQVEANSDPYGTQFFRASSPLLAQRMMARLAGISEREVDNVSTAVLRWPHPPLTRLAVPDYRGSVIAAGDTVDHINAKSEDLYQVREPPPAQSLRGSVKQPEADRADATLRLHSLPLEREDVRPLPTAAHFAPRDLIRGARSASPENERWGIGSSPSQPRSGEFGDRQTDEETKHLIRWEAYLRSTIPKALVLTDALIALATRQSDRVFERLHSPRVDHFMQNGQINRSDCTKLLLVILVDQYAVNDVRKGMSFGRVERKIDEAIRRATGTAPSLTRRKIDLLIDGSLVDNIRNVLIRAGAVSLETMTEVKQSFCAS